jgi:sugar phosphate permease
LLAWLIWFDSPERARWLGSEERDKILRERDAETDALEMRTGTSRVVDLLRTRTMWGLALAEGCAVYTQYLFLTWLPSYLQETRNLTIVKTGLFTALPYAGAALLGIGLGASATDSDARCAIGQGRRRSMGVLMMLSSAVILFTRSWRAPWVLLALFTLSLSGMATAISLNFIAGQRSAAQSGGQRQSDGDPGRRRQFVRHRGTDRNRSCDPAVRQLQLGVRHRRLVARRGRHDFVHDDAHADCCWLVG